MKIATIKVIEVPDGDVCTYSDHDEHDRTIKNFGYCKYFHFELWNKPRKEKIWKCKLFDEDLDTSAEEPQKCDRCKRSEVIKGEL